MPKYQIDVPGSGTFEVESPTDLTDAQAYQAVMGQIRNTPKPEGGIMGALKLGTKSLLGSQLTGITGLFGDANEAAKAGTGRQEALEQQYAAPASLEALKKVYAEKGLLPAAGEAISQIPKAIAQQLPQLGETFAGARLGAMAGSVAGPVGTAFGAVLGAAIPNLIQFVGTNLERQAQEQIKSGQPVAVDKGKAMLAAVPQTAVDLVETRLLFGSKFLSNTLGISEKALSKMSTEAVEKQAKEKLLPLVLKGTVKGAATEIPSEIAQQVLERAQAGLSLTSPDAIAEYGATAYQVSLLGPLGAVGRAGERGQARIEASKRAGDIAAQQAIEAEQAKAAAPLPPDETGQMGLNLVGAQEAVGPRQQVPVEQEQPLVGPEQASPQAELDFNQPYPKSRLQAEPPIIGQEEAKAPQVSELDLAKMRLEAGAPLTPTQQLLLQEDRAKQQTALQAAPTPQLEIPNVVGAGARPTTHIVDDKVLDTFGLTKAATKIKEKLRGLDLMKPEDAEKFDKLVEQHERKNAKIDMNAVEAFKAEKPEPVEAREVPEKEGLPARPYDARKAFQQAREAQFAFGQVAAPLSPRDVRAQAEAQNEARTGVGPVNRVDERGVPVPSAGVQTPGGVAAPESGGVGSAVGVTEQPDGRTAPSGEAGNAPLAQMAQQVAPATKEAIPQETVPRVNTQPALEDVLAQEPVSADTEELLRQLGIAKAQRPNLEGGSTINLVDRVTQGDLKGALQEIVNDKTGQFTPLDKEVASRLLQSKSLPKVEVVDQSVISDGSPAQYNPNTDTVQIVKGQVDSHTVLHETLHGFLHVLIKDSEARVAKGFQPNPMLKNLQDIYNTVKDNPALLNQYGLKDLSEFVSEAFSNPKFQVALAKIPYKRMNVFSAFGRAVLKALGIKVEGNVAQTDALTATLIAAEHIMTHGRNVQTAVGARSNVGIAPTQVGSNAFQKWFGDSKVVNEDGSPMVVYHGTPESFEGESFKPTKPKNRSGNVAGYYFTSYIGEAEGFAESKKEKAIGQAEGYIPSKEYATRMMNFGEGAQIIPVYLSIKNPFVVGSKVTPKMIQTYKEELEKENPNLNESWVKSKVDVMRERGAEGRSAASGIFANTSFSDEAKQRVLKAGGYDGFQDGRHWVAFEPNQIKSAIGNQGTYDPNTTDIAKLERTAQGTTAETLMSAFGGKPAEGQKNYIESKVADFNKAKDSWTEAYERNHDWVAATFGKGQNIASFDQAFNNRMYNHLMGEAKKGNMVMDDAKKALLRISTSQALHRGNLANQIIERGAYSYDPVTNRWEAVDAKDGVNMSKFEGLIKGLATKLGVEPSRARQIMGAAYEANRLDSMYKSLDKTEQDIARLEKEMIVLRANKKRTPAQKKEIDTKQALLDKLREAQEDLSGKVRHKTKEQVAAGMELYRAYPEIAEGTKVWNKMRDTVVNALVEAGVKTKDQAEKWLDDSTYVPFFRDMEDQKASGPQVMARGLRESMVDRTMKGSMREVQDPIENMYQWMQWSLARAISNKQLQVMLENYKEHLPEEVREGEGGHGNTFTVYYDGIQRKFNVADPAIAQAFIGLEPIIFPGIGAAVKVTNALRHIVTRFPLFSAVQLFSDSYTAMYTSGLKSPFGVLKEIAKEVSRTAQGTSDTRKMLIKAGILETHDYTAMSEEDAVAKRLGLDNPSSWKKLMRNLDRLSSASDNVIRQGVYNQAIKEGLSKTEAMEKAAEIVNFRRVSGDPRLQFASRVIPFFNAYLQVNSVAIKTLTGRGISPQERRAAQAVLLSTTAKIVALSAIYSMAMGDDEDYKRKNRVSRDRMFMIPGSGGFGIPIRTDVFALPKVIGEYTYQMMADNGTTDPKMMKDAMSRAVLGSMMPPSQGIPQIVRPILEVGTNHDFFQDREIVNATMRRLDTDRQFTKNTSEMAKAIGAMSGASPLVVDHLLRGYFGTAMTLTALATDDLINSVRGGPPRPTKSVGEMIAGLPNMGSFMSKDENTAVLSDFYQAARDVNKANDTLKNMKHLPREEQQAYREEHKNEIQLRGMVQTMERQLVTLKRREQMVREDFRMPEDRKRAELDKINDQRDRMAKNVTKLRQRLYG